MKTRIKQAIIVTGFASVVGIGAVAYNHRPVEQKSQQATIPHVEFTTETNAPLVAPEVTPTPVVETTPIVTPTPVVPTTPTVSRTFAQAILDYPNMSGTPELTTCSNVIYSYAPQYFTPALLEQNVALIAHTFGSSCSATTGYRANTNPATNYLSVPYLADTGSGNFFQRHGNQ